MRDSWSNTFWLDLGPRHESVSNGVIFPVEDATVTDWTDPMPAELWEAEETTSVSTS